MTMWQNSRDQAEKELEELIREHVEWRDKERKVMEEYQKKSAVQPKYCNYTYLEFIYEDRLKPLDKGPSTSFFGDT